MQILCVGLHCTSDDLFPIEPDNENLIDPHHPLQKLRAKNNTPDVTSALRELTVEEIRRVEGFVRDIKGTLCKVLINLRHHQYELNEVYFYLTNIMSRSNVEIRTLLALLNSFIRELPFFKSIPLYVKVSYDKMEVMRLDNHKTITRTATNKFSNNRILVAHYDNAQNLLRNINNDLIEPHFIKPSLKILIQQIEDRDDKMSQVEMRGLADLAQHCGAIEVKVVTHSKSLKITIVRLKS